MTFKQILTYYIDNQHAVKLSIVYTFMGKTTVDGIFIRWKQCIGFRANKISAFLIKGQNLQLDDEK